MKVSSETLPQRQVLLEIEVDDERHAVAMEQAYKKLAPSVQIKGFRKGKAPRALIEKQLTRHRLQDEAMDILIPEVYKLALEEKSITPVDQPTLEVVSHEPLIFKATVPLSPETKLGDYTKLKVPRTVRKVTDEEVEEAVLGLRRRYGTLEPVDRAAEKGDIIRGNVKAQLGATVLFDQEDIEFRLSDTVLATLPGLADHLVGKKKEDKFKFDFDIPATHMDNQMAGKVVSYEGLISEVKVEKLAEETDEFAKEAGEDFPTVKALRQHLRDDLQKTHDDSALHDHEAACLDKLVELATLEYPAVLVEKEIDRLLMEQAEMDSRDPRAQQLYLERLGQSQEQVRESVREEAEQRLRRALVLSQFAEAENITVEDSEIEAEVQRMASTAGENAELLMTIFGSENGRDTVRRTLQTRKTFERLVAIASADGAAAGASKKPAAKTPSKARRTAPRAKAE